MAFTNSLDHLPSSERSNKWRELLPGHYISGKNPTVSQFALTPGELESLRERQSSVDHGGDDDDLDWLDGGHFDDLEGSPKSPHHARLSPSDAEKPKSLFQRFSKRLIPGSASRRVSSGSFRES